MGYSSHSFFPDKGITSTPSPTFLSRQPLTVSGPNLRQEVKKAGNSLYTRETLGRCDARVDPSIVYVNFSQYWFEERGQRHVVVSKESRVQECSNIICISEMVGLNSYERFCSKGILKFNRKSLWLICFAFIMMSFFSAFTGYFAVSR